MALDKLLLNGTPYENGKVSGEYFKKVLNDELISQMHIIDENEELKKSCEKMLEKLKDEYPVYYEETRGKADGLGIPLLNYFSVLCPELMNLNSDRCTTIICRQDSGSFLISHNEDDDYIEGNFAFSKVYLNEDTWFATNDMYNMPFGNGPSWNSHGIFKTINFCHEDNFSYGNLPRYFAQRHLTEASSIEDMIKRCEEFPTASGFHVTALDVNKNEAVSIEVYSDGISVKHIDDWYIHSNHYIHGARRNSPSQAPGANSIFRLEKAEELFEDAERDMLDIMMILSHRGESNTYSDSIFGKKGESMMTLFNITFDVDTPDYITLGTYDTPAVYMLNYDMKCN